jgi:RNA polymerase sigma factor (sigma-70 family)
VQFGGPVPVVKVASTHPPRRQREVIVLRYYADLDVAEIAATLRITPGAVRATTSRALAALARSVGRTDR